MSSYFRVRRSRPVCRVTGIDRNCFANLLEREDSPRSSQNTPRIHGSPENLGSSRDMSEAQSQFFRLGFSQGAWHKTQSSPKK